MRNQSTFYYALYQSKTEITDSNNHKTGRYQISYANPVKMEASISAARGTADVEQFGISLDYEKTIITGDMTCPLSESSILWIDKVPVIDEQGATTTPNDYKIVKVAKSINYIAYAIKKVE